MNEHDISKQTLQRMPYYLQKLKSMQTEGCKDVSAPTLAQHFGYTEIQIRKDLSAVSKQQGKPKVGFDIASLIVDIENVLGYKLENKAVLIGAGRLGAALMGYQGFSDYGIEIMAAFDANDAKNGLTMSGKTILPMSQLEAYCAQNKISIGIITVPQIAAQRVCDQLVQAGVKAIWNFAQLHLLVPEGILVQNENMAANLALLFKHLKEIDNK